jgi:hypothetical protein
LFVPITEASRPTARGPYSRMIAVARFRPGVSASGSRWVFRASVALAPICRQISANSCASVSAISPSVSAVSTNGAVLTTPSSATRLACPVTAAGSDAWVWRAVTTASVDS